MLLLYSKTLYLGRLTRGKGSKMSFSYDKLWKKLIDEKMNKNDLQNAIKTTPKTIARMGRNENVSMETLGRICEYFQCDIGDILEYMIESRG